jgi:hypothetical protein
MNTAPELLEEKEVAGIITVVTLLGHVVNPIQVQEAYQKALGRVKKAQGSPGYPLPVGWTRPS